MVIGSWCHSAINAMQSEYSQDLFVQLYEEMSRNVKLFNMLVINIKSAKMNSSHPEFCYIDGTVSYN